MSSSVIVREDIGRGGSLSGVRWWTGDADDVDCQDSDEEFAADVVEEEEEEEEEEDQAPVTPLKKRLLWAPPGPDTDF